MIRFVPVSRFANNHLDEVRARPNSTNAIPSPNRLCSKTHLGDLARGLHDGGSNLTEVSPLVRLVAAAAVHLGFLEARLLGPGTKTTTPPFHFDVFVGINTWA